MKKVFLLIVLLAIFLTSCYQLENASTETKEGWNCTLVAAGQAYIANKATNVVDIRLHVCELPDGSICAVTDEGGVDCNWVEK